MIPALYDRHRGQFCVSIVSGNPSNLSGVQRDTVDAVLNTYGDKTAQWLSELTHREAPWRNARHRAGLGPGERGNSEILLDDMADFRRLDAKKRQSTDLVG